MVLLFWGLEGGRTGQQQNPEELEGGLGLHEVVLVFNPGLVSRPSLAEPLTHEASSPDCHVQCGGVAHQSLTNQTKVGPLIWPLRY